MSRTKREIPYWVKQLKLNDPEWYNKQYDPRSALYNGRDGKPQSALYEGPGKLEGFSGPWKEHMSGQGCRAYYKKEHRRARRRLKIEIE